MREPNFDRLRQAFLRQGEPDRVPAVEVSVHRDVKSAFLGRPVADLGTEVEFWARAGYEHVPLQAGVRNMLRPQQSMGRGQDATGHIQTRLVTRAQARYSVYQYEYEEREWAPEGEGVISSLAEAKAFPWPEAKDLDYSAFEEVKKYLRPGQKVMAVVGYVNTPVWWLLGFERFCFALADDPELVGWLYDRVGSIQIEVVNILRDFDCVGAFWHPDDIAYTESTMVSPRYLRRYMFPWYQRMNDLAHQKGLPVVYHSDGKLYDVLDDVVAAGFDALNPIEPKAMDIGRLKRQYGGRLCLIGNIDLSYTLTRGTPEEVEDEVRARIREIAPGGGYVVSSSNSVPEYVPLANFKAMLEATSQHGKYPIVGG